MMEGFVDFHLIRLDASLERHDGGDSEILDVAAMGKMILSLSSIIAGLWTMGS